MFFKFSSPRLCYVVLKKCVAFLISLRFFKRLFLKCVWQERNDDVISQQINKIYQSNPFWHLETPINLFLHSFETQLNNNNNIRTILQQKMSWTFLLNFSCTQASLWRSISVHSVITVGTVSTLVGMHAVFFIDAFLVGRNDGAPVRFQKLP